MTFTKTLLLLIALSSAPLASIAADTSAQEKAAVEAATKWLKVVDAGKYEESWKETASFFQAKITAAQWKAAAASSRTPFGKVISRKLKSKTYTTQPPGAPNGEYVVLLFDTDFAHKKGAVETVAPMLDTDKHWKVSGYYIR